MPPKAAGKSPVFRKHPHLYEINTWAWLEELSHRSGAKITLATVPDAEWDGLKQKGFDLVWLMGVWQRSERGRHIARTDPDLFRAYDAALPNWELEQIVGSPYGVRDYLPDARIGNWDELASVRAKLNQRGIGLILDFVSNHTALDHPWTEDHPEYYVRGTLEDFRRDPGAFFLSEHDDGSCDVLACGRDPYFPPWRDTAQINFFEPAARKAVIRTLRKICKYCDGLRCDMAMLLLNDIFQKVWGAHVDASKRPANEFWAEARAAIPDLILIAEAYWGTEQKLLELGFNYCYDKTFYDALRDGNPAGAAAALDASLQHQERLVRFLENHDEQRSAAIFGGRIEAVGTLAAAAPGIRFYHQGQLQGKKIHLPIQLGVPIGEPMDPSLQAFYDKILALTNDDVFHAGQWKRVSSEDGGDTRTSANIVAYEWRTQNSWKVIAANISGIVSEARIRFPEASWTAKDYIFFDALHDALYSRSAADLRDGGLYIRLEGWHAHLFDVRPA
jgi:hypothetical protein